MTLQMGSKLTNSFDDGASARNFATSRNLAEVPKLAGIAINEEPEFLEIHAWEGNGAALDGWGGIPIGGFELTKLAVNFMFHD